MINHYIQTEELTEEYLTDYFSRELDLIIKRLKIKTKQKLPDDIYSTMESTDHTRVKASNSNGGYSDPTGYLATKIAELYLGRKKQYKQYLKLKQSITDIINQYSYEDIELLKTHILGENLTEKSKEVGVYYEKARRRVCELIILIEKQLAHCLNVAF